MGYYGRLEDKIRARKLRKRGYSYKEIIEVISASKDTISHWCRDIELTDDQIKRLIEKRNTGAKIGCFKGAKVQKERRLAVTQKLRELGIEDVGSLSKRERFLVGIALYAGEGAKKDGDISFANSDPRMIKFMISWFREFMEIDETRIRGAMWLHEGLSERKAKKFWSDLTGIPINHFHKTYIAKNKKGSKKIRKHLHKHGIFSIRYASTEWHRRLQGWILGVLDDRISNAL